MFRSVSDFVTLWEAESASTIQVLERLTDASLEQRIDAEGRSLGRLAWHLAVTPAEMLGQAGAEVEGPGDAGAPPSASQILEAYRTSSRSAAEAVRGWSDEALGEEISVYGQTWTKGQLLTVLVLHQAHHRGQITVLMRQAGIAVPGVAGPAREEWVAMGMPAPE